VAYGIVVMKNESDDLIEIPVGFSWTVLIIGFLDPLILRKDFQSAVFLLVVGMLTVGLSNIFFAFFYNEYFFKKMIKNQYSVVEVQDSIFHNGDLRSINPIKFNNSLGKYYLWTDFCNIKYMKYFDSLDQISAYVASKPHRCSSIKHIDLFISKHEISQSVQEKYAFPINDWKSDMAEEKLS